MHSTVSGGGRRRQEDMTSVQKTSRVTGTWDLFIRAALTRMELLLERLACRLKQQGGKASLKQQGGKASSPQLLDTSTGAPTGSSTGVNSRPEWGSFYKASWNPGQMLLPCPGGQTFHVPHSWCGYKNLFLLGLLLQEDHLFECGNLPHAKDVGLESGGGALTAAQVLCTPLDTALFLPRLGVCLPMLNCI